MQELNDGVDIHGRNQEAFDLPERVIAKILVFRILYGGTQYGFVKDSDFTRVSTSLRYWERVIEKFYEKYQGIAKWHNQLLTEVGKHGRIVTPFGRVFAYGRKPNGDLPAAAIKNYVVQGTGADIVAIARVSFRKRWKNANICGNVINTVHDSIVVDCPSTGMENVASIFADTFAVLPSNINRIFNCNFNLGINYELSIGNNQADLEEYVNGI